MTTRFIDHLLSGVHAARPGPVAVPQGTLYACSTHGLIYQSDGGTWTTWATISGGGGASLPTTTKGDLVVHDGTTNVRLGVGANGQVLTADSAQASGIKWASAAGGVTHSYIGYNVVGASSEALANVIYAKQVTLTGNGLVASIGAYVKGTQTAGVQAFCAAIYSDAAGIPGVVLGSVTHETNRLLLITQGGAQAFRWYHMPIGMWLTAGTYWLAVFVQNNPSAITIAYDTGGSDHTSPSGNNSSLVDWGTDTNAAKAYSIRADFIA